MVAPPSTASASTISGESVLGFTVYGGRHHFGPELQFGHVLGDYFDNQVLLIKTAWGGKSLYRDFRPPSSGGTVGPYYTKMLSIYLCPIPQSPTVRLQCASYSWEF